MDTTLDRKWAALEPHVTPGARILGSNVRAEDFLPNHLQGNKIEIVYSRALHNYEENEK